MKKILCVIFTCICLSVPMVVQAEPTVFIDGEVAQEGSGGIIDLSKYVDDITKWAVGFVTNYNWSTGVDVVSYIYDNLTSINLNSNGDDSYSVDNSTYDEINILLSKGGYNGYIIHPAYGKPNQNYTNLVHYTNFTNCFCAMQTSGRLQYMAYYIPVTGYFYVNGSSLVAGGGTYNYDRPVYDTSYQKYNNTNSNFTYTVSSGNVATICSGSFSGYVFNANTWGFNDYFVVANGNTLASNSLSPQAFTSMTPTQISNIDYESWYDTKYDNSISVNNAYNYYNSIVAPEPQEVPTLPPYDVNLIYTDVNNNLTNYSNGLLGLPVSVDMLGMGFITATYLALPSAIQNLILLTLTLALAMVVTGVASFVARRIK